MFSKLLKKYNQPVLVLMMALALGLVGCGGGGGGGTTPSDIKKGVFLDSPVQGLKYVTDTLTGTTDVEGTFQYRDGEVVKFYLNEAFIGRSVAKDIVTPMDFVRQPSADDPEMVNPLRILQTLDEDSDPTDGISIPAVADGVGLDLDLTSETSVQDFVVSVDADLALIDANSALTHFSSTLESLSEPAPDNATQLSYVFSHAYSNRMRDINTFLNATLAWINNSTLHFSVTLPSGYTVNYQGPRIEWSTTHESISRLTASSNMGGMAIVKDINTNIDYYIRFYEKSAPNDNPKLCHGAFSFTSLLNSLTDTRTFYGRDYSCISFDGDYINTMIVEFYLDGVQSDLEIIRGGRYIADNDLKSFDVAIYAASTIGPGRGKLIVDYQLSYKIIAIDSRGGRYESALTSLYDATTDGTNPNTNQYQNTYLGDYVGTHNESQNLNCRYTTVSFSVTISDISGNTNNAVSGSYSLSNLDPSVPNLNCPASMSDNFVSERVTRLSNFGALGETLAFIFTSSNGLYTTCGIDVDASNNTGDLACGTFSVIGFPENTANYGSLEYMYAPSIVKQ